MDETKLHRLAEADPSVVVRRVAGAEAETLRTKLIRHFGSMVVDSRPYSVDRLESMGVFRKGPRAEEEGFDLAGALRANGISPSEHVYISWSRFTDLDEVRSNQFVNHFDEFWYPAADDIDICDETMAWLVSIDYYGALSIAQPRTSDETQK